MANDFKITISAVDKATEVVRRINAQMEKITRPMTDLNKRMEAFKNEVGLNTVVKGMKSIGKAAKDVEEKIMSIAAPMAALVGIGTIGGIVSLATSWGQLGFNIQKTAGVIGISTDQLQGLRGAANLAGVSIGELDSSLITIGDSFQDAMMGRNQGVFAMMNQLHISVHRLKDGTVDAKRGFMDIADAMQGRNVGSQRLIADRLGINAVLPLLQKGSSGIGELEQKHIASGGIVSAADIKSAEDFEIKIRLMNSAIDGLKNNIGNALIPVLTPLIDKFSAWVAVSRPLIVTNVSAWVKGIADWVAQLNFDHVISGIKALGVALGVLLAANFLGSLASLVSGIAAIGGLAILSAPFLAVAAAIAGLTAACIGLSMIGKPAQTDDQHPGERLVVHGRGAPTWHRDLTLDQSRYGQHLQVIRGHGVWMNADGTVNIDQGSPVTTSPATSTGLTAVDQLAALGKTPLQTGAQSTPLGIRVNNPTNMMHGGIETQYTTPEEGIKAAVANLEKNYQGLTLAAITDKWTGGARAGNSAQKSANYTNVLTSGTGLAANQVPDLNNKVMVAALIKSMIRSENGQNPYSDETVNNGVTQGMAGGSAHSVAVSVNFANAPAGITAKASSSTGTVIPTRIAYATPMTRTP